MIINFDNIGNTGGGGGGYVLPVATANRLGGVKVGSGLTIDAAGVLSTSGGTAPSGEGNVKVYMYDELYSGDTYDHYDMSVPNEMEALAKSGTPVYVLYRGQNKSVYLELTTKTGNSLVFNGADGDGYYNFSLVKNEPWTTSEILRSRNGDYEVVSQLPQRAQEGQLFYVKPYMETVPYLGYAITATTQEGYVAHVYDPENSDTAIYRSGTDFYWDYYNDGNVHKREDRNFYYRTDNENGVIYVYLPDSSWTITLEEGSTSATTDPYNVEITHDAETYRYQNSGFTRASGYDDTYVYFDYRDIDDTTKRQAVIDKIFAVQPENRKNIKLFVDHLSVDYISGEHSFVFEPNGIGNSDMTFTSSVFPYNGGGTSFCPIFANCYISVDYMNFDMIEVPHLFFLNVNATSHYLDSGNRFMPVNRATQDPSIKPTFKVLYKGKVFDAQYSRSKLYLDGKLGEKTIHGVWGLNDEFSELLEWSETADKYQTVSGLSNAGENVVEMDGSHFSAPAGFITGLTAETQLFVAKLYGDRCKITTDGTNISLYHYNGEQETWELVNSGTWNDSEIDSEGYPYHPYISNISTGATYSFNFNFADYWNPGEVSELVKYYAPFEGLMAFDTTNSSLNLYASGMWNTLFPVVP